MSKVPFDPRIAQIAIVVADMAEARERFASLLGMEVPGVMLTQPGEQVGQTYRGEPSQGRAKLAFFDLGGAQLELIEAIGEDTAWAEGFAEKGERVHHLAFWTEDMAEATRHMEAHGAPMVMRGDFEDGSGQYAYFDGVDRFGFFIELLEKK